MSSLTASAVALTGTTNTITDLGGLDAGAALSLYSLTFSSSTSSGFSVTSTGNGLQIGAGGISSVSSGTVTIAAPITLGAGAQSWSNSGSGTLAINGTINRLLGTTVNFSNTGTGSITSTSFALSAGIIGGYAIYGGTSFATVISGTISPLATASYKTNWGTGNNTDVTGNLTAGSGASASTNSLRFNTAATSLIVTLAGTNTISSGGILETAAVGNNAASIAGGMGISLTSGVGDLIVTQNNTSNALTISAAIVGSIGLTKAGAGLLNVTGQNSFTGTTTINAGTLSFGANAIPTNSSNTIFVGGTATIQYNGTNTQDISEHLTVADGFSSPTGLTVDTGANNVTFAGAITFGPLGLASLTKVGTGTLTLSSSQVYTGTTTINAGTLSVANLANGGSASGIGSSDNTAANLVISNATFTYTGTAVSTDRLFTIGTTGATINSSGTGALSFTNTGSLAFSATNAPHTLTLTGSYAGTNTLTASIPNSGSGATSVTSSGTGTWVLAGNNSYTGVTTVSSGGLTLTGNNSTTGGVTITGGTLSLGSANALGTSGTLTFNGGTVVNSLGTAISSPLSGSIGANFGFGAAGNNASNSLTLSGTAGFSTTLSKTVTLAGTNTTLSLASVWTNSTDGAQTLTVNGAGNTLSLGGLVLDNTGTTLRTQTLSGTGNITITGSVTNGSSSGYQSLTYTGTGTLTLNGANIFNGGITVSSGYLVVNGSVAPFSNTATATTVTAGGSLAGTGSFSNSNVSISGGTLTPGSLTAVGKMTGITTSLGFGLSFSSGTYNFVLSGESVASASYNQFSTAGMVNISGTSVNLVPNFIGTTSGPVSDSFWSTPETWNAIITGGSLNASTHLFTINNTAWSSLGNFSTVISGNSYNLVWTPVPVPEPMSVLALASFGLLLGGYARRKHLAFGRGGRKIELEI